MKWIYLNFQSRLLFNPVKTVLFNKFRYRPWGYNVYPMTCFCCSDIISLPTLIILVCMDAEICFLMQRSRCVRIMCLVSELWCPKGR